MTTVVSGDINVCTDGIDVLHRIEKSADTTLQYLLDLRLKYYLYVLASVGEDFSKYVCSENTEPMSKIKSILYIC